MHLKSVWRQQHTSQVNCYFWHFLHTHTEQTRGVLSFYLCIYFLVGPLLLCFRSFSFHTVNKNLICDETQQEASLSLWASRTPRPSWPTFSLNTRLERGGIFLLSNARLLNMLQDFYSFISTLIYSGNPVEIQKLSFLEVVSAEWAGAACLLVNLHSFEHSSWRVGSSPVDTSSWNEAPHNHTDNKM